MKMILSVLFIASLLIGCTQTTASNAPEVGTVIPMITEMGEPSQTLLVNENETLTPTNPATRSSKKIDTAQNKPKNNNLAPTPPSDLYLAPEMVGVPTNNSAVIHLLPAKAMEVIIEYGTNGLTQFSAPHKSEANQPLQIILNNLKADTEYSYTVISDNVRGISHTFHTARTKSNAFIFEVQGDSHPERIGRQFNPQLYSQVLNNAGIDQPDFYITIGDDFSVDSLQNVNPMTVSDIYLSQRRWLSLVDAPIYLVNGNHEQASLANLDGTSQNVAVWAQTSRNALFPIPFPNSFYSGDEKSIENIGLLGDYYAWEWGDALFVVIDPYWHSTISVDNQFGANRIKPANRDLWQVTLGDEQYTWFTETLHKSEAKYKFVFTHHVLGTGRGGVELAGNYEWGDVNGLKSHRPGWDKTIQQIMVDEGVTIFFQGHDHIFARQELDGVIYQTLPEPANPEYSWENKDAYTIGDVYPNSGRLRITVNSTNILVEYVQTKLGQTDNVIYTYTVQ